MIDTVKPAKIAIHQKAFTDEPLSQKPEENDHHWSTGKTHGKTHGILFAIQRVLDPVNQIASMKIFYCGWNPFL